MIATYRGQEIGTATLAPDGKLHISKDGNEVPISPEMSTDEAFELSCGIGSEAATQPEPCENCGGREKLLDGRCSQCTGQIGPEVPATPAPSTHTWRGSIIVANVIEYTRR